MYRYGQVNDLFYLAMKYIDGVDLQTRLDDYRQKQELMPSSEVGRIIRQVCLALDYAHSQGVIHRDVKPSNIMINQQGQAILTDFGLALLDRNTLGEIFGTPHYMAPEQLISSAGAVPQSDLYAVGVILYEMFTGKLPFEATEPVSLAMRHLTELPSSPRVLNPKLSPELEAVILRALAKEPQDRYPTGAALSEAVVEAIKSLKGSPDEPEPSGLDEKVVEVVKSPGESSREPEPSDTGFVYDVFISYSRADLSWVRAELLTRLEAAGLKTCLDFRDFKPGTPRPTQVQQAVENSRRMLLILTPDYLKSEWDEFANLMAQIRDPASHERRLIPLLKAPCELPPRLEFLWPIDFVDPVDWELAWSQLLAILSEDLT